MKIIYKYILEIVREQTISVPSVFKFLDIQMREDTVCMWAEVNPEVDRVNMTILFYGAGIDILVERGEKFNRKYLKTIQINSEWGNFVWHIFQKLSLIKKDYSKETFYKEYPGEHKPGNGMVDMPL